MTTCNILVFCWGDFFMHFPPTSFFIGEDLFSGVLFLSRERWRWRNDECVVESVVRACVCDCVYLG